MGKIVFKRNGDIVRGVEKVGFLAAVSNRLTGKFYVLWAKGVRTEHSTFTKAKAAAREVLEQ